MSPAQVGTMIRSISPFFYIYIYIYGDIPRISRGVFVFTNYVSFVYVVAVFAKVWVS